jgi:hypothetical protein
VARANDLRLDTRQPVMTVANVQGKFVGGTFSYEFELLSDGNSRRDQGSSQIWAFDLISQHCGPGAAPAWGHISNINGSGGGWTSRGRF